MTGDKPVIPAQLTDPQSSRSHTDFIGLYSVKSGQDRGLRGGQGVCGRSVFLCAGPSAAGLESAAGGGCAAFFRTLPLVLAGTGVVGATCVRFFVDNTVG